MKTNNITLQQLIDVLDNLYPQEYAEDWDNIGLHFGNRTSQVNKVLTSLDIRPSVVKEAIDKKIDTIIVHHPVIFLPIKRLDNSTVELRMYNDIIQNNMNVFVMHTNLDRAWDGMNDWLAQALGLQFIVALEDQPAPDVPGLGRIGDLKQAMNRSDLIQHIKTSLAAEHLTLIEREEKTDYQRIAVVGGSSFNSIEDAVKQQADVFITGDITYHKGHDAYETDILTVDAGHYIEHLFKSKVASRLLEMKERNQWNIEIIESSVDTNPFEKA